MLRKFFLILLLSGLAFASPKDDLTRAGNDYIAARAKFFPVWATSVGIHDYDSLLTDYSAESIYNYRNEISVIAQQLREIDTTGLAIDDYIDYQLLRSNIDYDNFILVRFPLHECSPELFIEEALNSIYYIMINKSLPESEKACLLKARLSAIPPYLDRAWNLMGSPAEIFYLTALETANDGKKLVDEACQKLLQVYPDSVFRIGQIKGAVMASLENYIMTCQIEKSYATGTFAVGKKNFNYLLKNIHFLNIDSDSLKKIGFSWYQKSNAVMDSLKKIIDSKPPEPVDTEVVPDTFSPKNVMTYYQWEINQTADFLSKNKIISIPENIGACVPIEMPPFMQATHRGIAYEPAPPFDKNQTGYFYVRPLPPFDSTAKKHYYNLVAHRQFKGSIVHEAFPGHHLQFCIANLNHSAIRKIQQDPLLAEGWALYCEQMAVEQGLFNDQDLEKRWQAVWGGIRFRAIRIIVDCSLHDGTMTPDLALAFMNSKLGDNPDYYTAEIRRYCANPTVALSYLTGKLMIMEFLEKAKRTRGASFSLKKFHDELLAEGTIPPTLIGKKLGLCDK